MTSPHSSKRLLTFSSGGWVLLIASILTLLVFIRFLYPVWQTGFRRAVGDGRNIDTYQFDLSNLSIPRATLVASGATKDQIRAVPTSLVETITPAEVALRNQNEREEGRFLVSTDRVIGVSIHGEDRAYPLRILAYHEIINDVLGGTPIAITYSPLCDSAVVFDRRIDGPSAPPVEFGVSGLLANSDLVMFDRREASKDESLWPQLALKAVAGRSLGKALTIIPFDLMNYSRWVELHPGTRVAEGLRTLKQQYKMEPYNTYLASDELKFPVSPEWKHPEVARKTKTVITSYDGGKTWKAEIPTLLGESPATAPATMSAEVPPPIHLYAFVFAWYAQHPSDTDYSALLAGASNP